MMRKKYFKRVNLNTKFNQQEDGRQSYVLNDEQRAHAEKTIAEGDRLFDGLERTLFSAPPSIQGAVAMTYAVSRLYVALEMAMAEIGINVEPYFKANVDYWRPVMARELGN